MAIHLIIIKYFGKTHIYIELYNVSVELMQNNRKLVFVLTFFFILLSLTSIWLIGNLIEQTEHVKSILYFKDHHRQFLRTHHYERNLYHCGRKHSNWMIIFPWFFSAMKTYHWPHVVEHRFPSVNKKWIRKSEVYVLK